MFQIQFYVQILVPSYLLIVKPHSFFNLIVQILLYEEREMLISVFHYGF
jgi:hypothetical protein